jgi:glycosyltransferase involved in cell wall biosynthesis
LFFILNLIKQPDIIHCHDYHLGRILSRINNAKRVLTVHGMGLEIAPLKYFDQLFAISFAVKKNIEYRSQYKCKVIYNGLLLDQIRKKGSYSLGGTLRIITIKRLNHVRTGQDLLIEAIGRLVKNHCEIDFQLSLVGEGKSRTYLEKQIADLHLNTNVVLLGNKRRDWIYEHLCDYDLCILPSRFEGFGLVLAESMAAKVPIIASNIDGPAEILEKGKYGFLFEKDNTNDLALKINTVVSYYKTGNIIEMTEKAYQHCKMNFNVQTTAINYCEAYQEIL